MLCSCNCKFLYHLLPFCNLNRSNYIPRAYCSQNKALDHLHDDVDVLGFRVKEGNRRARHLLHK